MVEHEPKPLDRIISDPDILAGKPVIRGTRMPVYLIFKLIAGGYDFARIIESYPDVHPEN